MNVQDYHSSFQTSDKSFTIIDNWLLDSNLTIHEKIVFIAIKRYVIKSDHATIPHENIARVASLSASAVKRAIKSLVKKKLLYVKSNRKSFKPNEYFLHYFRSSHGTTKAPFSSPPRPTIGSSPGPSFKNNYLKNTHLVCCGCKKAINETIKIIDSDGFEYDICSTCHSDLIVDTSRSSIKIDAYSLLNILKKYDSEDVLKAIDVIEFKCEQKEKISSFSGLLVYMLKNGIILPENYISHIERRRKKFHLERIKQKVDADKQKVEAEHLAKRENAEKQYEALTSREKNTLKLRAKKELPLILHKFDRCIHERMIDILINENKVS